MNINRILVLLVFQVGGFGVKKTCFVFYGKIGFDHVVKSHVAIEIIGHEVGSFVLS